MWPEGANSLHILVFGLKKRAAGTLDKRLSAEGFTTSIYSPDEMSADGLASTDIDLVIVDTTVVGDAEEDFLREVAASKPGLPAVLVVGENGRGVSYYRNLGFTPQVIKESFSMKELAEKIDIALPVVPEDGARILRAGDLFVDLSSRVVSVGDPEAAAEDKKVSLTPKEMALFEYFLRSPNQVLTRQALLRDIWGYDFDTDSNVADVYVRYLREKLAVIGKKDVIETVRGAGYRAVVLSQVQAERKKAMQISVATWTAVAATFLLAVGLLITYVTSARAVQYTIGPSFKETAEQTANKIDITLRNEIVALRNLSVAPDILQALNDRSGDDSAAQRDIRSAGTAVVTEHVANIQELQPLVVSDVTVLDRRGELVATSSSVGVAPRQQNIAWFQSSSRLKPREVAFSDIAYLSGRPVIDLFTPVYSKKKWVGSIKMTMELQGVFASITGVKIGKTGHSMLVDSKGVVVICPIFAPRSHQVDPVLRNSIVSSKADWLITNRSPHGGWKAIIGFASVPITLAGSGSGPNFGDKTWHILLTQDPGESYAQVFLSLWRALLLGIFAVAGITVAAYFLSRKAIRPWAPRRF